LIVRLSTRAKLEFDMAVAFLSQQNQRSADALASRIEAAILGLEDLPNRGRHGAIPNTREVVIRQTPYVLVYLVRRDEVIVLRIRHTSQDPSPD
jgi:plasmid stabilization system protein ParE